MQPNSLDPFQPYEPGKFETAWSEEPYIGVLLIVLLTLIGTVALGWAAYSLATIII